jgi:hypothetical protein
MALSFTQRRNDSLRDQARQWLVEQVNHRQTPCRIGVRRPHWNNDCARCPKRQRLEQVLLRLEVMLLGHGAALALWL